MLYSMHMNQLDRYTTGTTEVGILSECSIQKTLHVEEN